MTEMHHTCKKNNNNNKGNKYLSKLVKYAIFFVLAPSPDFVTDPPPRRGKF